MKIQGDYNVFLNEYHVRRTNKQNKGMAVGGRLKIDHEPVCFAGQYNIYGLNFFY